MRRMIFIAAIALWLAVVVLSGYFGIAPIYVNSVHRYFPSVPPSITPAVFGVLYFGIPYLVAALLTASGTAFLSHRSTAAAAIVVVPMAVIIFATSESIFLSILRTGSIEMHDSSSHPVIAAAAGFLFAFALACAIVVRFAYRKLVAGPAPSNSP